MFQVTEGKLPADCLFGYLPFSLMKVLRKIYSIDKFGIIFHLLKRQQSFSFQVIFLLLNNS
ncbi:MAG: hypothetical protein GYA35_04785 [Thermoanaerobaculaceae bacterium]|nr:hypothetical protein [Thermoanaerobaculaceae bacterium]